MITVSEKITPEFFTSKEACLVYFTTNDCVSCHALLPKVKEMAADFPKIEAFHISLPDHPELSGPMGIFSAPTLVVFFDGKEQIRKAGRFSLGEVRQPLERIYNLFFED
ncbi:MAG TPA: thioredoxin family protein [Williamwhitmania sp.]|nr:thioredoxin family protein [Williamwhitmania sp.]